jgi:hypothetical protein
MKQYRVVLHAPLYITKQYQVAAFPDKSAKEAGISPQQTSSIT